MRGKAKTATLQLVDERITPAYAGKRIKGKKFEYPI